MFLNPPAPPPPTWQGAELAMAQLRTRLEQIRGALQPPRPDIIAPAATEALEVLHQLELFWQGQPPGSAYYARRHKRLPPTGGFITQQQQLAGRQAQIDRETERDIDREERGEEVAQELGEEWRGDPQA